MYFDSNSNLVSCVPRERLKVRSGEVSRSITRRNSVFDFVIDNFSSFPGFRGVVTLQLFFNIQTADIRLIEINPRFGGGYPLSQSAGVNFPLYLISEYLYSQTPNPFNDWTENLLMLRYDSAVFHPC